MTTGSRTLKDAINEAMRDWVTNVETTNYVFGTVAGPHPFPLMVREYQRVIGDEARAQVLERCGRLPDAVAACVGGGSNAIGIFTAFVARRRRAAGRLRGRRRRRRDRSPRRVHHRRRAGRAARRALVPAAGRERADRSSRTRSRPGLDYPGVGPEHSYLHDIGRAEYRPITDAQAMDAFALLSRSEGIIPAIESAHALAGALDLGRELGPDAIILVNLSGRGDKDVETATKYFGMDLEDELDRARRRAQPRDGRVSARSPTSWPSAAPTTAPR